jgi:hypothetical protein
VALDEVHLQDQRFELRADHNPLKVGDIAHQAAGFGVVAGIRVEVGAHAVLEVDGLADIDNRPGGVFHQVAAGLGGQGVEDTLEVSGDFHGSDFNAKNPIPI